MPHSELDITTVDTLIAKLQDMAVKENHKHHRRAAYLVEFLRDNDALVAHTKTDLTMRIFIDTLNHIMVQAAAGWHLVKTFADPPIIGHSA